MISVKLNAYLRKAESLFNITEKHERILLLLASEKKYFEKNELLCFANYDAGMLEKILGELEEACVIKKDGWLVRIKEYEELEKEICEELIAK